MPRWGNLMDLAEKSKYLAGLREKAKGWKSMHQMQIEYAVTTLGAFDGNKTHAARALGITPHTMRNWLSLALHENIQGED